MLQKSSVLTWGLLLGSGVSSEVGVAEVQPFTELRVTGAPFAKPKPNLGYTKRHEWMHWKQTSQIPTEIAPHHPFHSPCLQSTSKDQFR